mgnify:CR=1 FL=1
MSAIRIAIAVPPMMPIRTTSLFTWIVAAKPGCRALRVPLDRAIGFNELAGIGSLEVLLGTMESFAGRTVVRACSTWEPLVCCPRGDDCCVGGVCICGIPVGFLVILRLPL